MKQLRSNVIRAGLEALYFSGAHHLLRPLLSGVGAIFMLHRVRPVREDAFQPNRHLEVTPALREYVSNKLERVTRHFDQVVDITVILCVEKISEKERRQRAEVTVHVKGKDIFAEQSSEDLYAAIDQLVDKLDRQVGRYKDRVQDHHHAAPKRLDATLG